MVRSLRRNRSKAAEQRETKTGYLIVTKEIRLNLRDIQYISIECQKCTARAVIPITTSGLIPSRCPGCNEDFDANGLQNAIFLFRKAFEAMVTVSGRRQAVTLHLAAEGAEGASAVKDRRGEERNGT